MPPLTELLKHKAIVVSLVLVGLILIGSVAYYEIEVHPPAPAYADVVRGSITEEVTGNGTVTPVENPDLSFVAGGRVAAVNVKVGDKVRTGQVLASIDAGVLSANYAAANASYAKLAAGPRGVDVAGKQTAVDAAQTTLANAYDALPAVVADAAATAEDAVHSTDFLFGSFNTVDYPRVSFLTHSSAADKAGQERGKLADSFAQWDRALRDLSATASREQRDAALADAASRLTLARDFFTDLSTAVNAADPALSSSEIAAVSAGRASVNGLIVSLASEKQTLAGDELALTSAQNALDLIKAGAPSEDIMVAKAEADAAAALLRQSEIVAPYSGTVASVAVKAGDVVASNASGVSVIPDSNFEVEIYLSEIEAAKLIAGAKAQVTLDAYGPSVLFPATLASVDRAPTVHNGVPSFKATLVFDTPDAKLAVGQGANVVIEVGEKNDALLVPVGAVVSENDQKYVLKQTQGGLVKTPVEIGLVSTSTAEIISGLSEGDRVAQVAGH